MSALATIERGLLGLLSPSGKRGRLLILTYHRVVPTQDPLLPHEPDAATFAAQMDVMRSICQVLPLPEAVRRLGEGTLPPRSACITFDDGYENNLSVALPLLEARGMSGTVFVATAAVDEGVMWNDLIIEGFRTSGGAEALSHFGIEMSGLVSRSPAEQLLHVLEQQKRRPAEQRWGDACRFFRRYVSDELPRLMLTREGVSEIAKRGHDVGAHTVRHPILAGLSPTAARAEITGSYAWVAETTGGRPHSFAYPNGWPGRDFDAAHAVMVREAGFALAVSTRFGCATRRSDTFELPRCASWDVLRPEFPLRLAYRYLCAD